MSLTNSLINIIFPILSHWQIWLSFFVASLAIILLYIYSYTRKPSQGFRAYQISIPVVNIISLYIFTKMLEGVLYQGDILKVDSWFNAFMLNLHSSWLNSIASFITSFGSGVVIVTIIIITIGILLLRKRWRFALLFTIIMLGTLLLQFVVKNLVNRSRPTNSLELISPGAFAASFPSGHAITAMVYVCLLIYSFKDDIKHATIKYSLIVIAVAFFMAVGVTRIYLNAHWFSDVVAGWSLGISWFMTVVLVERSITGLIPAIKRETKEAKPIKTKEIIKTVKTIIPKEK